MFSQGIDHFFHIVPSQRGTPRQVLFLRSVVITDFYCSQVDVPRLGWGREGFCNLRAVYLYLAWNLEGILPFYFSVQTKKSWLAKRYTLPELCGPTPPLLLQFIIFPW